MTVLANPEIVALAVFAAPGAVAGLAALVSVFADRRARARRLREAGYLNEMLRLDEGAPSPALRAHYEARLDEVVGGFDFRDCVRSPEAKELVYAYLRRARDGDDPR